MFPRLLILACFCILPLAVADVGWEPAAVAALGLVDMQALVSWVPGEALADAYRVYGVTDGGGLALLAEVPASGPGQQASLVQGGHARYAVSGVRGGWESGLVYAAAVSCITLDDAPWGVYVHPFCLLSHAEKVRAVVHA